MAIEVQRFPNQGSPLLAEEEEELIIQLPEEEEMEGGVEFQVGQDGEMLPMPEMAAMQEQEHNMNLAMVLDDSSLNEISSELMGSFEEDKESRHEWLTTFSDGLDLLGIKSEDRDMPFPGASGVTHPLLSEAATQFQAQAYKELLPPNGPVNTKIVGLETPEIMAQSQRVKEFMNYQITEVMQ